MEAVTEQFDDYVPGDSETQGWEEEPDFIPADEFAEQLHEQWQAEPADDGLAAYWEQQQAQLQNRIGRELNDTEMMALNNAIDNGATESLEELYDTYQEYARTHEGKEALMKARLQELRQEGS
jgi:hypothetical protein